MDDETRARLIPSALAEYFDCEVEDVGAFVVCFERRGPIASSVWSIAPVWHLIGLVEELRVQIEKLREPVSADVTTNGRAE